MVTKFQITAPITAQPEFWAQTSDWAKNNYHPGYKSGNYGIWKITITVDTSTETRASIVLRSEMSFKIKVEP